MLSVGDLITNRTAQQAQCYWWPTPMATCINMLPKQARKYFTPKRKIITLWLWIMHLMEDNSALQARTTSSESMMKRPKKLYRGYLGWCGTSRDTIIGCFQSNLKWINQIYWPVEAGIRMYPCCEIGQRMGYSHGKCSFSPIRPKNSWWFSRYTWGLRSNWRQSRPWAAPVVGLATKQSNPYLRLGLTQRGILLISHRKQTPSYSVHSSATIQITQC